MHIALAVGALAASARDAEADPPVDPTPPGAVVDVHGAPRPTSYAARIQTTGTRDDQPVHDLPQSITVIDRHLMDDVGARRTEDVLPFVPGVQLFSGYGGTWDDYTVRGFRVWAGTTYRNGYLSGYSGASAVDAVNVERVEVVRGPASALYGPGLPGGSINFVTKRPKRDAQTTFGLSGGSFSTFRGEVDSTGPLSSNVLYRATASADTTAGYRDDNTFRRWLANPVVEIALSDDTKLLVEAQGYQIAYRADPMGVPAVGGDQLAFPTSRSYIEPALPLARIEGALVRIELDQRLSKRWSVRVATQSKGAYYEEKTLWWNVDPDGRTLDRALQSWKQNSGDTALQVALRGTFETGKLAHQLLVGADASHERVAYRQAFADPALTPLPIDMFAPRYGAALPGVVLPASPSVWTYGVAGAYVNDIVTVLPELKVMVGARLDSYAQESTTDTVHDRASEGAVSPRAGAVVDVLPGLSVFANASRGFWPSLGVQADGTVLRPERSFSTEAGLRAMLPQDLLTVDLAGYRIDNKHMAIQDPTSPSFQKQLDEGLSTGFEALVTARAGAYGRLFASYAFTDARIADDPDPNRIGLPLPLTAKHSGGVWAQAEVPIAPEQKAGLGVGGTYTGERTLGDDTPALRSTIPGYFRVDGVLSYALSHVRTAVRVENVLGSQYVKTGLGQAALLPGAPRSVLATVQVKL